MEVSLGDIAKPAISGVIGLWIFGKQRPITLLAWIAGAMAPFCFFGLWWATVHVAMLAVNIIRWSLRQPYV